MFAGFAPSIELIYNDICTTRAAVSQGVAFRLGCPVIALDEGDETSAIVIKGGERIEANVIVGADGSQR